MHRIILSLYLSILILNYSCGNAVKPEEKLYQVIDSLKGAYSEKYIGITLTNNQAGSRPLTSQYAYVDENKSDLSFELFECNASDKRYRMELYVSHVDGMPHSDMVRIEEMSDGIVVKSGYVPYTYIKEFKEAAYYKPAEN